MHYVLIIHKVEDYNKWRPVYDENETNRRYNGSKSAQIFQNADNPNEVVLLFEWDNLDNARKFYQSLELKNKMQLAGVRGEPQIYFIEGIDRTSA